MATKTKAGAKPAAARRKTVEVPKDVEAQEFKDRWLEAKARNSELNQLNDDLRRELKSAQDERDDALGKIEAAEAVQDDLRDTTAALEACRGECSSLESRLTRAKKQIEAAKQISEGLAALS